MADRIYKIFVINLGSTSTKVAYYENETCVVRDSITHDPTELAQFPTVFDQKDLREKTTCAWLDEHGISLDDLDAFVTRGPQTEPVSGGVYELTPAMAKQGFSGEYGTHVCSVGSAIALDLTSGRDALPLTVDTPSTDEFGPLARYSGLPAIERKSHFQALNSRATAQAYAASQGRRYDEMRLVVVMLGGGVTCVAHDHGRMVDGTDGLEGDGCFSNNRCNGVPVGDLVRLCYSGQYDEAGMMHLVNGGSGLYGYLGTTDTREVEARIAAGDEKAREVYEAMCYQISKDVAGMATVLEGDVDAILLTGGMANSEFVTGEIKRRCGFIAPIVIMAGEREMESLALNSLAALRGEQPIQHFVPSEPERWA